MFTKEELDIILMALTDWRKYRLPKKMLSYHEISIIIGLPELKNVEGSFADKLDALIKKMQEME